MKRLRNLGTKKTNLFRQSTQLKRSSKIAGKPMAPNQARLAQIERQKKGIQKQQQRLIDNYMKVIRRQRIKTKRLIREHGQDFEGSLTAETNELVRLNGDDYKGKYHRFEDGTVFAGSKPGLFNQEELVPKSVYNENPDIFKAISDAMDKEKTKGV